MPFLGTHWGHSGGTGWTLMHQIFTLDVKTCDATHMDQEDVKRFVTYIMKLSGQGGHSPNQV